MASQQDRDTLSHEKQSSYSLAATEPAGKHEDDASSEYDSEPEDGSRKRKRTSRPMSVSCELCKQRKVKCDRGQPSCGWCIRNTQICEYRERKKPGLRAGYGRELEARLDRLEGALQSQQLMLQQLTSGLPESLNPRNDDDNNHSQPSLPVDRPSQQESSAHDQRHPPSHNAYSTPTTQSYSRSEDLNGIAPTRQYQQGLPNYSQHVPSYARVPNKPSPDSGYQHSHAAVESPSLNIPDTTDTTQPPAMTADQDSDLPPYDLLYALVDLYFKHINTWCPILHRRATIDLLFGSSSLTEADRILLHAIVATTLRFCNDTRLNGQARDRYYSKSKQKVLLYGLEYSSVKALQALVILTLDIVGSSNGPPGWNLLALITRSVVQLGLAVETTSISVNPLYPSIYTLRSMVLPEPKDFIEDESRRRLFWTVYLLDRYATISTAFEFALDDKEIDRKLPCRDELFVRNQPVETNWFRTNSCIEIYGARHEHMGGFSYYIEILGIMSLIHRFLKKPVDIRAHSEVEQWQREYRELDSTLNNWKFSLPSEYSDASTFNRPSIMSIMLHITYYTAVIRLHASAAYPTTSSAIFTPSFSASKRCLNAVEDTIALSNHVRRHNLLPNLGPPFAFSLWVASRLLLVHGSTISHSVSPAITTLVDTLREMGTIWAVANRYATLLQRVLDEYHDSEQRSESNKTPATVRLLADMRRTAYDLDFLISRQPRFKLRSCQPSRPRTPAVNELEYLDVFDFFNVPRLPDPETVVADDAEVGASEFNITNFMFDAEADWFTEAANR